MIIFNERKYIEENLLAEYKKPYKMGIGKLINYLARYYFADHKGESVKDFSAFLINEIQKFDINKDLYQDYKLDKLIKDCCKKMKSGKINSSLLEIESINIPAEELDEIKTVPDEKMQKVLFTFHVLARVSNNPTGWVNFETKDVFELANVTMSNSERNLLIFRLKEAGLLKLNRIIDKRGMYVEMSESDVVGMTITDFKNLGKQFICYAKPGYMICERCGRLIKRNSNVQKYCKHCYELVKLDKDKNRHKVSPIENPKDA